MRSFFFEGVYVHLCELSDIPCTPPPLGHSAVQLVESTCKYSVVLTGQFNQKTKVLRISTAAGRAWQSSR